MKLKNRSCPQQRPTRTVARESTHLEICTVSTVGVTAAVAFDKSAFSRS
jgi:hypothetical protein